MWVLVRTASLAVLTCLRKFELEKRVLVSISLQNKGMIGSLRQLKSPRTDIVVQYIKLSDCHTKGYCLLSVKRKSQAYQFFQVASEALPRVRFK